MDQHKLQQLQQLIESAYLSLKEAREYFASTPDVSSIVGAGRDLPLHSGNIIETSDGSIVQGYFDGQQMVGDDEKKYSVPANYASKSKLVEGDRLKLTIKHDGTFMFKQIAPVERKRLKGVLFHDEDTDQYRVVAEERSYRVLTASVTYFKGQPRDEVILLVPKDRPSLWGAVEHIMKSSASATPAPHASESIRQPEPSVSQPQTSQPTQPIQPQEDPLFSTFETL